jgi:hypothetical protein
MAFKALAMYAAGKLAHYFIGQASVLQKLVEGKLQIERPEPFPGNVVPGPGPLLQERDGGCCGLQG